MIAAVRAFRARPRLLVSTLVAIAAAALLPARFALSSRLLLAWDAGAAARAPRASPSGSRLPA